MHNTRQLSLLTGIALVIANMVGSGVYTSLGYQLMHFETSFSILLLWAVGGLIALCGALVYAELATVFPQNGGEMNFLHKLYGPLPGFLAGWISALAGFAAPVAIVCLAIGNYAAVFFVGISPLLISMLVLLGITLLHASKITTSATFQRYATLLNIVIMLFIIVASYFFAKVPAPSILPTTKAIDEIQGSGQFAVNLYWVLYAYTGWNAAAYIAGEIKQPGKNLPIALVAGTLLVTGLYLLLNYAFMHAAPIAALKGEMNVGFIVAQYLFGKNGAFIMTICICITLIGTASSMTFAGPRVTAKLGDAISILRSISKQNKHGVPHIAVYTQSGIALFMIWLNQFQFIIDLIGFLLSICTSMAVAGIFIVRKKQLHFNNQYKTPLYPLVPLIFLGINSWIIYYGISLKPLVSLYGMGIVLLGVVSWYAFGNKPIKF